MCGFHFLFGILEHSYMIFEGKQCNYIWHAMIPHVFWCSSWNFFIVWSQSLSYCAVDLDVNSPIVGHGQFDEQLRKKCRQVKSDSRTVVNWALSMIFSCCKLSIFVVIGLPFTIIYLNTNMIWSDMICATVKIWVNCSYWEMAINPFRVICIHIMFGFH